MNIKSVKLKNAGFNGAEIHHLVDVVKNNRKSVKLVIEKPKDPIHKDLENLFKDLREHLLYICEITNNMDEKEKMFTIHESEVVGVEFDSDGFILHGTKSVFGNKKFKLDTPKIEEIDAYPGYAHVQDIIKGIVEETRLYIQGEKKVSDQELVERWIEAGKEKSMDMDTFKGLTAEEQAEFCSQFLQKQFGAIVLMGNDIDTTGMDTSATIEEIETEFTIGNGEEVVIPVAKGKKDKKQEPTDNEPKIATIPDSSEDEAF